MTEDDALPAARQLWLLEQQWVEKAWEEVLREEIRELHRLLGRYEREHELWKRGNQRAAELLEKFQQEQGE